MIEKFRLISVLSALLLLNSCAAVGVFATNDPYTKLRDANDMLRLDRPLAAERFIREAIPIFEQRGDEKGLAAAYHLYGSFFISSAVEHNANTYRLHPDAFLDRSATLDNRREKAIEYLLKAREIESKLGIYDALTNSDQLIANQYYYTNRLPQSCEFYDKSLGDYAENIKTHPATNVSIPPGASSYPEWISGIKKNIGCPETSSGS